MLNFLLFVSLLGILIIVHEFGHCLAALRCGVRVEQFSIGFGPVLLKRPIRGILFSVGLIPLGGYVKLAGDSREDRTGSEYEFLSKAVSQRAWVIAAGPLLNYLLAFLVFWLVFSVGFPMQKSVVGEVLKGYPAETAGIQKGDAIIKINDTPIRYWSELTATVYTLQSGTPLRVILRRDGIERTVYLRTRSTTVDGTLEKRKVSVIGVMPSPEEREIVRYNPFIAFFKGFQHTLSLSSMTVKGLAMMVTGKVSFRESMTGPIGIYYITTQAAKAGIVALLNFLGVLSLSLAIFNIVPFTVLDGGHLFFLLVEKIRGRPLPARVEATVTQFGISVLVLLVVFIFYNDMIKFGSKLWIK